MIHGLLVAMEWLTYRSADFVISANASFRELAITRGGKRPDVVEIVYSIPDIKNIYRTTPDLTLRNGRRLVLGYLGIIGIQDGVDDMVRVIRHLLKDENFSDFHAVIIGDGPALGAVRALSSELGVDDYITFTGYLTGERLMRSVSAFDVGLIPDPVNASNDIMSMNKVFEYSALGIPTVAYQLTETKRLLGDAGTYAEFNTPESLAKACLRLLNDRSLREECSKLASALAERSFIWTNEAAKYVGVMESVLSPRPGAEFVNKRISLSTVPPDSEPQ